MTFIEELRHRILNGLHIKCDDDILLNINKFNFKDEHVNNDLRYGSDKYFCLKNVKIEYENFLNNEDLLYFIYSDFKSNYSKELDTELFELTTNKLD